MNAVVCRPEKYEYAFEGFLGVGGAVAVWMVFEGHGAIHLFVFVIGGLTGYS
jgi:hypothetical protein